MSIKWILIFFVLAIHPYDHSWGKETSIEEDLIDSNKWISKQFDSLANRIDLMLSTRRGIEKNKSRLSLIGYTESSEGRGVNQTGHVGIDLRLPNFEKEWKLRFSSFDNEDEFEGLSRNRTSGRPNEEKYGTSLAFARKLSDVQITLRPRLELQDPLVSSFLLKLNQTIDLKYVHMKNQLKLFAHSIDGTGQSLNLDFERPIFWGMIFRWFNEEQYLGRYNQMNVAQGPMVMKMLTDRMALSQTLSLNSSNRTIRRPNEDPLAYETNAYHLTSYNWIFTFSHELYRNVFHYQLSPSLNFNKAKGFKGEAAVLLRTELIF